MERILIRHLSGARASQVDEFPAEETREILVGRDPEAQVRFDPSREDLVSRQHVKIVRDPESPSEFAVVDLQSRNGTFLNRQRVYAPARLTHNDVIQLGPAGPEFRFEMDPPPLNITKPVREPLSSGRTVGFLGLPRGEEAPESRMIAAPPRPIGRATVERMLGDTFTKVKHESDKAVWVGAAALTAILIVGGGAYFYLRQNAVDATLQAQQSQQMMQQMGQEVKKTPEIAEAMRQEVVRLQGALQTADEKSAERMQRLSRDMAAQAAITRKEQVAAARQVMREIAGQLPATGSPTPVTAGQEPVVASPDPIVTKDPVSYDQGVRRGVDMLQNGDSAGAMRVAQQLMQAQPNRWEAYSIAGSVAKVQNKPSQAKSMFERALSLAPDEVKPSLQQALQEIARSGQQ